MTQRTRTGGRAGNKRRGSPRTIEQMPFRQPINTDRPTEPLDEAGVQTLHLATMEILRDIGIQFMNADALAILKKGGAIVNGENVRFDPDLVMELLSHAPETFTLMPRNPAHQIKVGDGYFAFGNVSSPPNYWNMETGKRSGDFAGFEELTKLTQYFNCIHLACGYPVEPIDIHAGVRHLDCLYSKLTLTDKICHGYSLGRERIEDAMEMVRIAGSLTEDELEEKPRFFTNINSVSPLKHDFLMLDGSMRMARRGQLVVVTPFTLAGAMAPVTMAGAVALSLAEGLAAICLLQMVRPGAPCMIGTFTSNVDMKTGAPAFGTPEYIRATQMTGQMARFYGLPLRSSATCTANVPDGQAMWETVQSLWAAMQSGTNMVYHSAGWLEGGLIASPEKFVMDCEVLQQFQRYFDPSLVATTPGDIALDAVREVGYEVGANYFSAQHTQERYEEAFYQPFLSDWRNFEAWAGDEGGGQWTATRAHRMYKEIIEEFEPPPMEDAVREELADFVARRKSEGGVKTDF